MAGQPSRRCHGAVLPAEMEWGLLHKSSVLFCISPSLPTVNVLIAPPLLGQSLPCSVVSKRLPMVRLFVHRNALLMSPLKLFSMHRVSLEGDV